MTRRGNSPVAFAACQQNKDGGRAGQATAAKAGQALQYAKLTHEQDRTFGTGGHLLQDNTHSLDLAASEMFGSLAKICLAALLHI
jgi:hypothetical protein